jgi:hypothetical protein
VSEEGDDAVVIGLQERRVYIKAMMADISADGATSGLHVHVGGYAFQPRRGGGIGHHYPCSSSV